jgi:hypothetical protein
MLTATKLHCKSLLLTILIFTLSNSVYAQEAKFQQLSGDSGIVSMEAENYSDLILPSTSYWELVYDPEEYSGDGAMKALPEGFEDHKVLDNAQGNAPILDYSVNFVEAKSVHVWVRASHLDGFDDSVWFGIDDLIEGDQPVSFRTDEQEYADEWYWLNYMMNEGRAILPIESAGVHHFQLFMREPSFKVDKIVLTTDENYRPDDEDPMGPPETLSGATDVESVESIVSEKFSLAQNYPNPFNPRTTIKFSIPDLTYVTLKIYNSLGQEVAQLISQDMNAGVYTTEWNAAGFTSGVYFYRLSAGKFSETQKLILMK